MSQEYQFEIRPDGMNALQVIFKGKDHPIAGLPFRRPLPKIGTAAINTFRRGEAGVADVQKLAENVSDWLLQNDLKLLISAVEQKADESFRFVFSVDESLRESIGDLPMELLQTEANKSIVLLNNADGIVYLLPKVGHTVTLQERPGWPMRILLVRSNPGDLGGAVPVAAPIRDRILECAKNTPTSGNVQVDILSREGGALGLPTWEWFMNVVPTGYDVLVYLGHGDVTQLYPDVGPISYLQFEKDNADESEPVTATQLATVLHRDRIPVVLLAGCLTAANPGGDGYPNLARWMRGNQGVAQALVNSTSGVTFAVGMRSKIQDGAATLFLIKFFESLFKHNKGNVELAVHHARQELFLRPSSFPSWAAPVVFSALAPEPIFSYLAFSGPITATPEITLELYIRRQVLWPMLADLPVVSRPQSLMTAVKANRQAIGTAVAKQGAMLLPELLDAAPGTRVALQITLEGNLTCRRLQVKALLPPGLSFVMAKVTQALIDAGFAILIDPQVPGIFQIQPKNNLGVQIPLPNGVVVEAEIDVAADAKGIYLVSLEVLVIEPAQTYWPGSNAVIVAS